MKMNFGFNLALLLAGALAFAGCDKDDDNGNFLEYRADLTDAPTVTTNANGTWTATYDDDRNELEYTLSWNDMAPTAAHLHNEDDNSVVVAFPQVVAGATSPVSGTITLTAEQESLLKGLKLYTNVHSTAFPAGEIQGQVEED